MEVKSCNALLRVLQEICIRKKGKGKKVHPRTGHDGPEGE